MTIPDFIQHGLILFIVNCRAIPFRQGNGQPVDFVLDSFQASEDALDIFFQFHIPTILMFMNNLNEERTGYSPNPFLLFFFLRLRKSSS